MDDWADGALALVAQLGAAWMLSTGQDVPTSRVMLNTWLLESGASDILHNVVDE